MGAARCAGTIESVHVQAYHRRTERSNATGEVARCNRIAIGFSQYRVCARGMTRNNRHIHGLMLRIVRTSASVLARQRLLTGLLLITIGAVLPVVLSECFFASLRHIRQNPTGSEPSWNIPLLKNTPLFGYRLLSDRHVVATMKKNSEIIWHATYSIDKYGRRTTPVDNADDRKFFAVFLGCSFTFGEGVNDDETLPFYTGRYAPEYMPYNYGIPGHGANSMLHMMTDGRLRREIPQERGFGVFVYMDDNARRVGGSMRVFWGRDQACYEIHDGRLRWMGSFRTAHPWRTWIYDRLLKSHTISYLNVDIPPTPTRYYPLMEAIVKEMDVVFRRQFPGSEFYVLIYPRHGNAWGHSIADDLRAAGIQCLDYRELAPDAEWDLFYADSHPVPRTNEAVAMQLVKDLKIGASGRL